MEKLLKGSCLENLKQGSIVPGRITEIRQNDVVVDIGGKSEGVLSLTEFADPGELQIGQNIEVWLERLEDRSGHPVISYDKAQQQKNWDNILSNFTEGTVVSGRIKGKVRGGLVANIGVDAFLPASQIDVQPPKNLDQYLGQTYDFQILKINTKRRNIVVSRRSLIEDQQQRKRQQILEDVKPGAILREVRVKNITDYGAFIDLDGLDGLLHITDMSWGRISHPNEMLRVGDKLDVVVIEIDRDRERISLGLKQITANPWDNIAQKYPVGTKINGKVVNLVPYGAFVELEPGVEALIHVTELSWTKRITKPSEVLKIGDEVTAVVLAVQGEEQKISLGVRQLEENPWQMVKHNYPIGARVNGKVRNLTAYGAFVELEEGIDGMVHVSDMSWTRKINHPSEMLKKGDVVDAVVLDVDPSQQRIALGIKQLTEDPWQEIERSYKIGDLVTGKVSKITSYGAFIELREGIDGLVHISQVGDELDNENSDKKLKDVLKVGQEVTTRVIKIDKDERRVGLSIKAASYNQEQWTAEVKAYDTMLHGQDLTTLGDLFENKGV